MAITGAGVTGQDIRVAQAEENGDVSAMVASDKRMLVDEDGFLRIAKDGDLAVVVPKNLRGKGLEHVHGSALTGHYRSRRTVARMRGRFGGRDG